MRTCERARGHTLARACADARLDVGSLTSKTSRPAAQQALKNRQDRNLRVKIFYLRGGIEVHLDVTHHRVGGREKGRRTLWSLHLRRHRLPTRPRRAGCSASSVQPRIMLHTVALPRLVALSRSWIPLRLLRLEAADSDDWLQNILRAVSPTIDVGPLALVSRYWQCHSARVVHVAISLLPTIPIRLSYACDSF